jgi:hypothetical protein
VIYGGSCHCGAIRFEVEGELTGAVACNCSICSRKGALLWAVPRDQLRLLGPDRGIGTYVFDKAMIAHRFCRTCGIHPFAEDASRQGDGTAYVSIRCLDGVEPASVPIVEFDGRSI